MLVNATGDDGVDAENWTGKSAWAIGDGTRQLDQAMRLHGYPGQQGGLGKLRLIGMGEADVHLT